MNWNTLVGLSLLGVIMAVGLIVLLIHRYRAQDSRYVVVTLFWSLAIIAILMEITNPNPRIITHGLLWSHLFDILWPLITLLQTALALGIFLGALMMKTPPIYRWLVVCAGLVAIAFLTYSWDRLIVEFKGSGSPNYATLFVIHPGLWQFIVISRFTTSVVALTAVVLGFALTGNGLLRMSILGGAVLLIVPRLIAADGLQGFDGYIVCVLLIAVCGLVYMLAMSPFLLAGASMADEDAELMRQGEPPKYGPFFD